MSYLKRIEFNAKVLLLPVLACGFMFSLYQISLFVYVFI